MAAVSEPVVVNLESLIQEHQADVWRYLRYLGASAADADDLTQETFLAVGRSKFEQRSPAQTAGFLRTVARNQLLMARRRQGREVNTVALESAETVWAERIDPQGTDGYLDALGDCLENLDGRARSVVDRFYRDRCGRAEIATSLNMKPDGVKTLLRRTRDILRQCIERRITRESVTSSP